MSASQRRFFSGDTLRQALVQAANHFQLAPEEIAYQTLDKRHGFIRNRPKVLIEVDAAAPRRQAPAVAKAVVAAPAASVPAPVEPARVASGGASHPELGFPVIAARAASAPAAAPQATAAVDAPVDAPQAAAAIRSAPPAARPARIPRAAPAQPQSEELVVLPERPRSASERFPVATGPMAIAAEKGLQLLLGIAGLDLSPKILEGEDRLEIELLGEDSARCFEEDGEILRAIEHLLPRLLRGLGSEAMPCRVDSDNFHEIREEQLRTMAQRVAEEVRRKGRPRTLEPMNPADRRVVHMTLEDDPGVATASDGDGYFKRVTVRPA